MIGWIVGILGCALIGITIIGWLTLLMNYLYNKTKNDYFEDQIANLIIPELEKSIRQRQKLSKKDKKEIEKDIAFQ